MLQITAYKAQQFNLSKLQGISDQTLEMHFKLYEGYMKSVNELNGKIAEMLRDGRVDQDEFPGAPASDSDFVKAAEKSFGNYDLWKTDFVGVGKMRGVGWAVCYQDPHNGMLSNHWITLHEVGNVSGFIPILVMDVWEHAFILDYAPADRPKYIEAFFSNINWQAVDGHLRAELITPSAAA